MPGALIDCNPRAVSGDRRSLSVRDCKLDSLLMALKALGRDRELVRSVYRGRVSSCVEVGVSRGEREYAAAATDPGL